MINFENKIVFLKMSLQQRPNRPSHKNADCLCPCPTVVLVEVVEIVEVSLVEMPGRPEQIFGNQIL